MRIKSLVRESLRIRRAIRKGGKWSTRVLNKRGMARRVAMAKTLLKEGVE